MRERHLVHHVAHHAEFHAVPARQSRTRLLSCPRPMSSATRESSRSGRTSLRAIAPDAAKSMSTATMTGMKKTGPWCGWSQISTRPSTRALSFDVGD